MLFASDKYFEEVINPTIEVFTLATLNSHLKLNYYYLNVVQYYNIVSEVLMFVSIKQGNKLLGGIKNKLDNNCTNDQIISSNEIHRMKLTLFLFKLSFDNLLSTILEKLQIEVTESYKIAFDTQVTEVLNFLESSKNHENICSNSNDVFKDIVATKLDEIPSDTSLEKYYFIDPIDNINTINNFSKIYFKI